MKKRLKQVSCIGLILISLLMLPLAYRIYYCDFAEASFRLVTTDGEVVVDGEDIDYYDWPSHKLGLKPGGVQRIRKQLDGRLVPGVQGKVMANSFFCYEVFYTISISSHGGNGPDVYIDSFPFIDECSENEIMIAGIYANRDPRNNRVAYCALKRLGKIR